jgi:hypothetical protein
VVGYVANDYAGQTALALYETRINSVVSTLRGFGANVMTWVPPATGVAEKAITLAQYEQVARQAGLNYSGGWLDVHREWGAYSSNLSRMYDTVHPNTVGHTAMHDFFLSKLAFYGA